MKRALILVATVAIHRHACSDGADKYESWTDELWPESKYEFWADEL